MIDFDELHYSVNLFHSKILPKYLIENLLKIEVCNVSFKSERIQPSFKKGEGEKGEGEISGE
ncbi:MAG TPA: hypothetical protein DCL77_14975 [Prolixibacteraceae bacterium]|jgi:hypothetical protein|nr:hypothetical protein [Prolixibacteraceae bacterium]